MNWARGVDRGRRDIPKKCQANVDQQVRAASCDKIHPHRRNYNPSVSQSKGNNVVRSQMRVRRPKMMTLPVLILTGGVQEEIFWS
jgi:hypothetical protein